MTYLGTRPPTVDEWEKYELHHRSRMSTKPGITGMWQVSGRSDITDGGCELFQPDVPKGRRQQSKRISKEVVGDPETELSDTCGFLFLYIVWLYFMEEFCYE